MEKIIDYNVVDTDYVDGDGVLHVSPNYNGNVQVRSEADLTEISALDYYQPGAFAHTTGWANVWELDNDHETWEPATTVG